MRQTVQLPQDLYEAVSERAKSQCKTADDLVVEWVSEKIDEPELAQADKTFEQDAVAFEALLPELLLKYPGQYVAIYQGNIVGNGENRLTLVKEIYSRFGEVPCFVGKVTSQPPRRVRLTSIWKAK